MISWDPGLDHQVNHFIFYNGNDVVLVGVFFDFGDQRVESDSNFEGHLQVRSSFHGSTRLKDLLFSYPRFPVLPNKNHGCFFSRPY